MAQSADKSEKDENAIWETIKVVLQALILAAIVRTFFFQPFNIPTGSMISTLFVGDYIFVNKLSYGYSKYSLPFSPDLFDGRIFSDEPERGDIAVFRLPRDTSLDYVKRVIGLPGDTIQMQDGQIILNGTPVKREKMGVFSGQQDHLSPSGGREADIYVETLPNGVTYNTLDITPHSITDNTNEFKVPEGHYFMMGDNRDNSLDSRTNQVGYVPLENFVGKANVIFFSIGGDSAPWELWKWPSYLRPSRIFTGL